MSLEKLFTYQDLAARWGVCVRTVKKWTRAHRMKLTLRTVRVKESTVKKIEDTRAKRNGKK